MFAGDSFKKTVRHAFLFAMAALFTACGAPTPDPSSTNGQAQIMDAVDVALSSGDCTTALNLILPVYNSANTNNAIRLKTASAYGCSAGVNFFALTANLLTGLGSISTTGIWPFLAQTFPSAAGQDHHMEGAFFGMDALESVLNPGVIILPAYEVGAGSDNVGSVFVADRTPDANLYLVYVAMASIGTVESRYGNPNPTTFARQTTLPWTTTSAMDANGCGLSASVLNFLDAVGQSETLLPSSIASGLGKVQSGLHSVMDQACAYGCANTAPTGDPVYDPHSAWVASGCTAPVPCAVCPSSLRNRSACTGAATDVNSCAAAGIINFINSSLAGWQQ